MHPAIALRSLPDSCYATIVGDVSVVDRLRIVKARVFVNFNDSYAQDLLTLFFRNFKRKFSNIKKFF